MSVGDLYKILTSDKYDLFFCCIKKSGIVYRYKIPHVTSIKDLEKIFEKNSLRKFESGVNSDEINVFEAEYIDCYKKYPL